MKKIYLLGVFLLLSFVAFSQNIIKESLFEGMIGDKKVQLYIQTRDDYAGCMGYNNYTAILKYNGTNDWIFLEVYANDNNSFLLVDGAVGRYDRMIQIMQKGKIMTGYLYDTNHHKERVLLEKSTSIVDFETYRRLYDETYYLYHDC